jgi:microsomal prostaglandin-E synthase 1
MPISSINPALFAAFALTAIILSLKALFLGASAAATRGKLKSFLNAEDAAWLGGVHVDPDPEAVARIGRAQRNDLENLLLFFVCGTLYILADGSAYGGFIYCGAFLVARTLHTVAYLGRRPMLRRNAYTVGFLVIVAMSLHVGWLIASSLTG